MLNARLAHADDAQLSLSGSKAAVVGLLLRPENATALVASGRLEAAGDTNLLDPLATAMDEFDPAFNVSNP